MAKATSRPAAKQAATKKKQEVRIKPDRERHELQWWLEHPQRQGLEVTFMAGGVTLFEGGQVKVFAAEGVKPAAAAPPPTKKPAAKRSK
jgi:hypothetical protein